MMKNTNLDIQPHGMSSRMNSRRATPRHITDKTLKVKQNISKAAKESSLSYKKDPKLWSRL